MGTIRETSPAVLMAEATIPVTTFIKEENGMDDLRVVYVKVKGEQEMANAVMDTGAQMPVVRPDVVEGQSIDNRGSIQITSAFGEHEMGEVKDSNMELNDLRHGVVPVSKNLVNDMLICSSDYEVLIENTQMIRNPAKNISRTFKERKLLVQQIQNQFAAKKWSPIYFLRHSLFECSKRRFGCSKN
ncbi:hypothetical protein TNCV_546111 [Trichonephila clavipes]|nr:hypothetical protein TNCV_546111 [Trichonephila clavipes]